MWSQPTHFRCWSLLRRFAGRPGMDYYDLRHGAATMLLEMGVTPWDVAQQLGHDDGGLLVQELYGHPSEASARARVRNAWAKNGTANGSGAAREQPAHVAQ